MLASTHTAFPIERGGFRHSSRRRRWASPESNQLQAADDPLFLAEVAERNDLGGVLLRRLRQLSANSPPGEFADAEFGTSTTAMARNEAVVQSVNSSGFENQPNVSSG